MTNDEIINKIIQQMPLASVSINICDAATKAAEAALSFKDTQHISEQSQRLDWLCQSRRL